MSDGLDAGRRRRGKADAEPSRPTAQGGGEAARLAGKPRALALAACAHRRSLGIMRDRERRAEGLGRTLHAGQVQPERQHAARNIGVAMTRGDFNRLISPNMSGDDSIEELARFLKRHPHMENDQHALH